MPRRLVQESRAARDIAGHLESYLERDLFDTADRFVDVFEEVLTAIRDHPERSHLFTKPSTRTFALWVYASAPGHGFPHVLFYHSTDDEVRVFRVLHGAMDRDAELPG